MICPKCHGNGYVLRPDSKITTSVYPCPECGGCGVAHCCEGDQPSERDKEVGK